MIEPRGHWQHHALRYVIRLLALFALLATSAEARADEPRVALSLNWMRLPGAEDCIDAAELARTVEQQLGRSVFVSPTAATRVIEGWVEPANPGWHVVLRSSDAEGNSSGKRELTSPSDACSSLNRSIVLALTLLAQSAPGVRYEPPTSAVERAPPMPPAADQPTARVDDGVRRTVPKLSAGQAELGPTFDIASGALPETAVGGGLRATIGLSRAWMAELTSTFWAPQTAQIDTGAPPFRADGLSFSRTDVAAGICPLLAQGSEARVALCGGVMGSAIAASSPEGSPSDAYRLALFGYLRAEGDWGIASWVWLVAAAGLASPMSRTTFVYQADQLPAYTWTPFVMATGQLGLVLHLGP